MLNFLLSLLEQPLIWLSHLSKDPGNPGRPLPSDVFGRDVETGLGITFHARDLARHGYLLGSTGCGKTSAILKIIEADIRVGHSLVVADLRGDLVNGTLGLCCQMDIDPERITLLDLREKEQFVGFNPLGGAGYPHIRALHVLDVVASEAESWGVQLEETLRSALLVLATANEPLTNLEKLFYDRAFRSSCLSAVGDEALVSFWNRFDDMTPDKQQSWTLPVLNKISSLLSVPSLRDVLSGQNDCDLGEILNRRGHILLISLAADELHRSSRMFGSLVVSAISREMMARVNIPEKSRNPVRLYVDEFENFAGESFEGLIAEGRRFGLTLVLSHQTLSQLPIKLRSVIRNNVGVQVIFQCGFEDATQVARELPDSVNASCLRELEVGQAYVMKRNGSVQLVQFSPPKRLPNQKLVDAYRASVLPPPPDRKKLRDQTEVARKHADGPSTPPEDLL